MTTQLLDTEITFDRITKDYAVTVCGVIVGFGANYREAEQIRTQVLAERQQDGRYHTATLLDGAALDQPGETPGVDQTDPSAPPDPDPAPGRCPTCNNSGATCFDCGALELSALGRTLRHEMRDDRPALLRRLRSTRRNQWPLLARAYALEIGGTPWVDVQPTLPGILWLWTTLEHEASEVHPLLERAEASAESYAARTGRE